MEGKILTCKNCGSNNDGIRVNGKTFCTSCGELMAAEEVFVPTPGPVEPTQNEPALEEIPSVVPQNAAEINTSNIELTQTLPVAATITEPASFSPETYKPEEPAAKFITPSSEQELATDTLGAELEVLDMFEEVAQNNERNQNLTEKLNTLEAEEEVLELIEELPQSTFDIQKSNRPRIHKNKAGYELIGNEPDPIEEPELPVPADMLVEDEEESQAEAPQESTPKETLATENPLNDSEGLQKTEEPEETFAPEPIPVIPTLEDAAKEEEQSAVVGEVNGEDSPKQQYDVLKSNEYDWQEKTFVQKNKARAEAEAKGELPQPEVPEAEDEETEPTPQKNNATQFFTNYLKSSLVETKTPKPKKKRKRKKANKKVWIILGILLTILAMFVGLGIYVNQYLLNPEVSLENAKQTTQIPFKEPSYIPAGYKISAQTTGSQNNIELVYSFINDSKRTISIKITKAELTDDQLFSDYVKPRGHTFLNYQADEVSYWYVSDNILFFKDINYVYEITSSVKMTKEELQRIGEGVKIDQNISS